MTDTLALAEQLIKIQSITPNDNGCQKLLREQLKALGFTITDLSENNVTNTLALLGTPEKDTPFFLFSGHTDVVPTGPHEQWRFPPFAATQHEGKLYGRGSADMKSAIAAMVIACKTCVNTQKEIKACIGFAITSDEEGPATNGSRVIADYLKEKNWIPNYVLVGEATSVNTLGDMIKIGRRGSLCGQMHIKGKQGHIAYPDNAHNPIHAAFPALKALCETTWDNGNKDFQPSSFQISNIHAGTGATNVIPGDLHIEHNFRFCPESHPDDLIKKLEAVMTSYQLTIDFDWQLRGMPYYSQPGKLREACVNSIQEQLQITTKESTIGGGSDGRFFAPHGSEVIEFGFINDSIHQIDECIIVDNLEKLKRVYHSILTKLCL
jgi:succinyl-diaminopimelate desuccinylase